MGRLGEATGEATLTFLGTGDALVSHIYNTCFVLDDGEDKLLVDAGGGNGILTQLDKAGIAIGNIHNIFVTHAHTDHILGVIWVVRMFIQLFKKGKVEGQLHVWSHEKVISLLMYNLQAMLSAKLCREIGPTVVMHTLGDGDEFNVGRTHLQAFDIHSTKERQFGFLALLPNGQRLCCLGDEPYNGLNRRYAEGADWLTHEAFCRYAHRDIYHPYEKHHSTATDAARTAQQLGVKHLILYHTEEDTIAMRKRDYTEEASAYYDGPIYVPDDLEEISLDR